MSPESSFGAASSGKLAAAVEAARKRPELLAPAGGWEQLEYAIRFGADAVYLAADRFGMRQRACNFALDDIPRAVSYAHDRGVKVHVTCNVVMHDDDIAELPAYLEVLESARADAVIVGDLGAAHLANRFAPHVDLHVSTQASVSNAQAALVWRDLGAKRIVCARELSLEAIAALRQALPADLELEAFVHGSMCMAISGRCLISDYLNGRSALAGHCTQPCRWNYALQEETRPGMFFPIEQDERGSYLMNAQDLNMLAHLDDLKQAGIDSFKIEGRNKKAYYVATVVNAYRQVIDGADPADLLCELDSVSHRPYSTGFFYGPAHQTIEDIDYLRACDWAADVLSCEEAGERWQAEVRCRNRFLEGGVLEVVSPGAPMRSITVRNLHYVPDDASPVAVEAANRSMETYRLTLDAPLKPHDILRIRH